jgi:flagellar hook-basal body complex protein FliE
MGMGVSMIDIHSLQPQPELLKRVPVPTKTSSAKQIVDSFTTVLSRSLQKVNTLEHQANILTQMLVTGEIENIHDVMIAAEKAKLALNFTMSIRDKVIRAYDEIMAMGVR